ncbi:MAG: putative Ig domain-containing protein [Myxococcota bacterium]|nr:putative Ig domain-containing protein [Myxococcota bacterium]
MKALPVVCRHNRCALSLHDPRDGLEAIDRLGNGLPAGLTLSTATGTIAGTTPRRWLVSDHAHAANMGDPCPWDSHTWAVHGDMPAGQAG